MHNQSVTIIVSNVCQFLPEIARPPCVELIAEYGPAIIRYLGTLSSFVYNRLIFYRCYYPDDMETAGTTFYSYSIPQN